MAGKTSNGIEFPGTEEKQRICEEAIAKLHRRKIRKVPRAIIFFVLACFNFWMATHLGITQEIGGKSVLLLGGTVDVVVALLFICWGIQQLYISPDDTLLLLLAEVVLKKKEESKSS